jgi:hypothetical protein
MGSSIKWVVGIVVVIVLAGVAWKMGLINKMSQPTAMSTSTPEMVVATSTTQANTTGLPTDANDSSDAAMAQDSAAIDAQMQGMTTDQASLDQSMSDKPISQAY